eukprot:jgi/Chlat1/7069/Chrsp57S06772
MEPWDVYDATEEELAEEEARLAEEAESAAGLDERSVKLLHLISQELSERRQAGTLCAQIDTTTADTTVDTHNDDEDTDEEEEEEEDLWSHAQAQPQDCTRHKWHLSRYSNMKKDTGSNGLLSSQIDPFAPLTHKDTRAHPNNKTVVLHDNDADHADDNCCTTTTQEHATQPHASVYPLTSTPTPALSTSPSASSASVTTSSSEDEEEDTAGELAPGKGGFQDQADNYLGGDDTPAHALVTHIVHQHEAEVNHDHDHDDEPNTVRNHERSLPDSPATRSRDSTLTLVEKRSYSGPVLSNLSQDRPECGEDAGPGSQEEESARMERVGSGECASSVSTVMANSAHTARARRRGMGVLGGGLNTGKWAL